MGTDYYSYSGLAGTYSNMVKLINNENYLDVLTFLKSCVKAWDDWKKDVEEVYIDEVLRDAFDALHDKLSYSDFISWLDGIHEIEGEAGKYDGDAHLKNEWELESITGLWKEILEALDINLPSFDCHVFNSYRKEEGCPFGEVAFVFTEDECYTRKPNEKGKNLKAIIGDLDGAFVSWVDMSY